MGALARAIARQAAEEAATTLPAQESAIEATEITFTRCDGDRNRQNRPNRKTTEISQAIDNKSFKSKSRRIDNFQDPPKNNEQRSKAANDELNKHQVSTNSGMTGSAQIEQTNKVVTKEVNGIKLPMPEHYYKGENLTFWMSSNEQAQQEQYGDGSWIISMLLKLPYSKRAQVSKEYSTRYKAAFDAEPDDNKRTNKAALAANSWMRKVTK